MKYIFLICLLIPFTSFAQWDIKPSATFTVSGLVKNELTFHIGDEGKYKQDSLGDVAIKNHQGDTKYVAKKIKGILLKTFIDSAGIHVDKHKEYSELYVVLTATDCYKNVYSYNELSNSEIGEHIYVLTGEDGKNMSQMDNRIEVMSLGDYNSGRRHLRALVKIEVKKVD